MSTSAGSQYGQIPPGTIVVAANGEELGTVLEVHPHYLLVDRGRAEHKDLEVPSHAVARYDGGRLYLTVNREALTPVDDEESAARRLHFEAHEPPA